MEIKDSNYWDERARLYGCTTGGLKAVCSYGMPYFYNRYIDIIQRKAVMGILRSLDIRGKDVLDVGCGIGRWCREFSRMGAHVTGADLSDEMIKIARAKKEDCSIRYINAPISGIDLPSGSFDLITGITVLQHITDRDEFGRSIRNIVRLLKNGGKVLIMDVAPSQGGSYMFSSILSVRTEMDYISAFKDAGLKLDGVFAVDVVPFKHRLIRRSKEMPRPLFHILALLAVALSLPVDYIFSGTRFFRQRSWHKVFLFSVPN